MPRMVMTGQQVTPAGVTSVFPGRVSGAALDALGRVWVLAGSAVHLADFDANSRWQVKELGGRPGWQGLIMDPLTGVPLVTSTTSGQDSLGRSEPVVLLQWKDDALREIVTEVGYGSCGAPAFARVARGDGRRLGVIPLTVQNRIAVVDLEGGGKIAELAAGQAPYGAVVSANGDTAYVSNWGGRVAEATDQAAGRQRVVVDERGIVATGTVTRYDLTTLRATATIQTELHPTAMAWDEAGQLLYVANSNSDSITIIDTKTDVALRHVRLRLFSKDAFGITPTAVTLSVDGKRLYAACAGINAVAVLRTADMHVEGLIPTAWYPISVGLSEDQSQLLVGCLQGAGSGDTGDPRRKFVRSVQGVVQIVPVPTAERLREYSRVVAFNTKAELAVNGDDAPPDCWPAVPIPPCSGGVSPIKKAVLVIKENRTFDQVLGDLGRGNGAPDLATYGRRITANQHRLAEEFVTLDNLYATGIVSAEGHQWLTQAYATSYTQWQGYSGRTYPFDGSDPIAYSSRGFLWDLARRAGRTVRVFGEFAPSRPHVSGGYRALMEEWRGGQRDFRGRWQTVSQIPGLDEVLVRDYPAYTMAIPDVVRAEIFLNELRKWTDAEEMPDLTMVQLPANHTVGTTPGEPAPAAMVADNDLALGMIVEGLSKSPFWRDMAIFVVEDDAQDGVDHVDGHRTVAQVISPYTRRGHVDSTFYSHQSIVKTIELILGLPPMTLFDLIATDMRESFTSEPDFTPYEAVAPEVSLLEVNPPLSALTGQARKDAQASMKMNWAVPDEAPWAELNRILWRAAKGPKAKYPGVREAAFRPLMLESEAEEARARVERR